MLIFTDPDEEIQSVTNSCISIMKTLSFLVIILAIASCGVNNKSADPLPETDINNTWILKSMYATFIKEDTSEHIQAVPRLTINVESMQYSGSDGCNRIFGTIDSISDSFLDFGPSAGTMMACPDMETPRTFLGALDKTRSYTINDSLLILWNESGEELLRFMQALESHTTE